MRWVGGVGLVAGVAAALVGCGHTESEYSSGSTMSTNEYTTPSSSQTAQMNTQEMQKNTQQATQPSVSVSNERQPVAGHDNQNVKLQPQGKYSVPAGSYKVPQGEYLAPKGIYGERGKIESHGKFMSQGEYGTYTKPEGTVRQPEGVTATPEGTFFKPFGSSKISNERQPVAGHDTQAPNFFVRDDQGRTWAIRDPSIVKRVEQKLSDQGCDPGRIDGVADQQFSKALTQCQDKLGVQTTGVMDAATARALGLDWSQFRSRYEQRKNLQEPPQPQQP